MEKRGAQAKKKDESKSSWFDAWAAEHGEADPYRKGHRQEERHAGPGEPSNGRMCFADRAKMQLIQARNVSKAKVLACLADFLSIKSYKLDFYRVMAKNGWGSTQPRNIPWGVLKRYISTLQ